MTVERKAEKKEEEGEDGDEGWNMDTGTTKVEVDDKQCGLSREVAAAADSSQCYDCYAYERLS